MQMSTYSSLQCPHFLIPYVLVVSWKTSNWISWVAKHFIRHQTWKSRDRTVFNRVMEYTTTPSSALMYYNQICSGFSAINYCFVCISYFGRPTWVLSFKYKCSTCNQVSWHRCMNLEHRHVNIWIWKYVGGIKSVKKIEADQLLVSS